MNVLITGVFGQDGSYLAERLTAAGVEVWGLVHRHGDPRQQALAETAPGIRYVEGNLTDQGSLFDALRTAAPDTVYHLGAVSPPAAAWRTPTHVAEVTGLGTLRLLEAVRQSGMFPHVVTAGSLLTHGPYGAAKQYSTTIARDYRQREMAVSTAVFGGHHSPRRQRHFFARKVTAGAADIAAGRASRLSLGPLNRVQDWGDARDFVAALLEIDAAVRNGVPAAEHVVTTGCPHSSEQWVAEAFAAVGLDWRDHVDYDPAFAQPTGVTTVTAQPSPALAWTPTCDLPRLIADMVTADLRQEVTV